MKILPFALALTVVLTGCSSLPSAQDLAAEGSWQELGLQDGKQGLKQRRPPQLSDLAPVDNRAITQYRKGYRTGAEEFCNENNAFSAGLAGRSYDGQCSFSPNEDSIIQSWEEGLDDYYNTFEGIED